MATDNLLDLSTLELVEVEYKIKDFAKIGGVVTKSQAIRHFHAENPNVEVKHAGAFKINHDSMTITMEVRVQPRHPRLKMAIDTTREPVILPDADLQDKYNITVASARKLQSRVEELERMLILAHDWMGTDDYDKEEVDEVQEFVKNDASLAERTTQIYSARFGPKLKGGSA